jgi:hypothetical protein
MASLVEQMIAETMMEQNIVPAEMVALDMSSVVGGWRIRWVPIALPHCCCRKCRCCRKVVVVVFVTLFLQQVHDTIWQRMIAPTEAATQTIIIPSLLSPSSEGPQVDSQSKCTQRSSEDQLQSPSLPTVVAAADHHHLDRWLLRQRRLLPTGVTRSQSKQCRSCNIH